MTNLSRFGVSVEEKLLSEFDALIAKKGYTNRSEAFRDLIRQELVKKEWARDSKVVGAITLVYDHHKRELVSKLTDISHGFQKVIISTQHIHLDHNNCLEIIAAKGSSADITRLSDALKSVKGVKHGALSMSSTGTNME